MDSDGLGWDWEEKVRNWATGAIHPDFQMPMHSTRPRAERLGAGLSSVTVGSKWKTVDDQEGSCIQTGTAEGLSVHGGREVTEEGSAGSQGWQRKALTTPLGLLPRSPLGHREGVLGTLSHSCLHFIHIPSRMFLQSQDHGAFLLNTFKLFSIYTG